MLFSVVVPIYNVEKYLRECIDSILAQTVKDYEIILVDDGSLDGSPDICDEYAAKYDNVKVIHKPNGGLSDARNAGTDIAVGDYIIYIDSDDYFANEYVFEGIKKKTEKHPDIILYKFRKYFEKTKTFGECSFDFNGIYDNEEACTVINKLVRKDAFYCAAWAKVIKRSLLCDNNICFKKGIISEDIEWYYHVLMKAESFALIDEVVIIYRQRAGSISASPNEKSLSDNIDNLEYWISELKGCKNESLRQAIQNSMGKLYANLLILYSKSAEHRKKYKHRMKKMSFLLDSTNPRARIINKAYKVLGFNLTILILGLISKIKR